MHVDYTGLTTSMKGDMRGSTHFFSVKEDSPHFHFILFNVLFPEFRSRTNKMPVLIQIPPSHPARTLIFERGERDRERKRAIERERESENRQGDVKKLLK